MSVVALVDLPLTAILACAPSFGRIRIRASLSLPNCALVESNTSFESLRDAQMSVLMCVTSYQQGYPVLVW